MKTHISFAARCVVMQRKVASRVYLRRSSRWVHRCTQRYCSAKADEGVLVKEYATRTPVAVSLQNLLDTAYGRYLPPDSDYHIDHFDLEGKHSPNKLNKRVLMQVACFLHKELPVRLAHRVADLDEKLLRNTESIEKVVSWYRTSFSELLKAEDPCTTEAEEAFATIIDDIYNRHRPTMITVARAAHEIRRKLGASAFVEKLDIQERLDNFYLSRIGIRMLIGQYLALREQTLKADTESSNGMVGLIQPDVSPMEISKHSIYDAEYMCLRAHGEAPKVTISGRTDLTFPYVPSHLNYMLVELLKNSMRATVERHGIGTPSDGELPPIRIIIADGEENEDVCIKVSDEGGGIPRSNMHKIWSYLFTTANSEVLDCWMEDSQVGDFTTNNPLAGLGYGLPIARNYARYFGGDLHLNSMEGIGTDSYLYLHRLANKKEELFNQCFHLI